MLDLWNKQTCDLFKELVNQSHILTGHHSDNFIENICLNQKFPSVQSLHINSLLFSEKGAPPQKKKTTQKTDKCKTKKLANIFFLIIILSHYIMTIKPNKFVIISYLV